MHIQLLVFVGLLRFIFSCIFEFSLQRQNIKNFPTSFSRQYLIGLNSFPFLSNYFQVSGILHSVKNVPIWNYFWSVFSRIQSECGKIRTRNNSAFEHFSPSVLKRCYSVATTRAYSEPRQRSKMEVFVKKYYLFSPKLHLRCLTEFWTCV